MVTYPVEYLSGFGFSDAWINNWKKAGHHNLLPLQAEVMSQTSLMHGQSLLVSAPTSAGKTFIAEIAMASHLQQNRKVVYLVPTKALAEERYREFYQRFARRLGYRVVVATRERPETDKHVMKNQFDILVAVYEKMKSYLVARPELLSSVALVVADEIQALADPERGGAIDLLLTKIASSTDTPQCLALSAVVGADADRLANWLHCKSIVHKERPQELHEGAVDVETGNFIYRGINKRQWSQEQIVPPLPLLAHHSIPDDDFTNEAFFHIIASLVAQRGEQVLVFVPTRYTSRNWAHLLANRLSLQPCPQLTEQLNAYAPSCSNDLLRDTLSSRVAFHNADLPWDIRLFIEEQFRNGNIRVLISTSTLGQGVNLTAGNVLHVPSMVVSDEWTGRPAVEALSRSCFRNHGGRGGRYGLTQKPGRSILIARNRAEAERLAFDYVENEVESLKGRIQPGKIDEHILDLLVSGIARNREEIARILRSTFSGLTLWPHQDKEIDRQVKTALQRLIEMECCSGDPEQNVYATGQGEVAAGSGLRIDSVTRLIKWLKQAETQQMPEVEAILVACSTSDGRDFPAGSVRQGDTGEAFVAPLRDELNIRAAHSEFLAEMLNPPGGFTRAQLTDYRKTMILREWISNRPTRDIEDTFHIFSGTIANLASQIAWILQSASALARRFSMDDEFSSHLESIAERLILGCDQNALGFRGFRAMGFSREYLQILVKQGFDSPKALSDLEVHQLTRWIPQPIAEAIVAEIQNHTARPFPKITSEKTPPPIISEKPELEKAHKNTQEKEKPCLTIDISGTGRVWWNDYEIELPGLAFQLLVTLAEAGESGASYEDIERSLWPDAHVERQQIHAHRRRLIKGFSQHMNKESATASITVEKGRGLRLTIPASQIKIKQ